MGPELKLRRGGIAVGAAAAAATGALAGGAELRVTGWVSPSGKYCKFIDRVRKTRLVRRCYTLWHQRGVLQTEHVSIGIRVPAAAADDKNKSIDFADFHMPSKKYQNARKNCL